MSDTINRWQFDADGLFIAMLRGEKTDFSVNIADVAATGDAISTAVWSVGPGVLSTAPTITGTIAQTALEATAAGVIACSLAIVTTLGYKRPVPFRVVVK